MRSRPLPALVAACIVAGVAQASAQDTRQPAQVTPQRQQALVHMVRQDCGACHGMQLTGGLGPPLTPQALSDRTIDSIVAVTLHGRPGTPMPPWKSMLSEADALWIAEQLRTGFPEEPRVTK